MSFIKKLRPWDFVILLIAIAGLTITILLASQNVGNNVQVSIKGEKAEYVFPLEKDRQLDIPGPLGLTRVEIKNNAVRFIDSPCRDKICVHMGWLRSGGQWAACLPNKVFMVIVAKDSGGIDATMF